MTLKMGLLIIWILLHFTKKKKNLDVMRKARVHVKIACL